MNDRRNKAGRGDNSEAGFTLVELLVGLALFSLLVTLLFGNVRFGLRAWQNGSKTADELERVVIAQDLLRRIIGNLYPMVNTIGANEPIIDFTGTKDAIGFLGNAPNVASDGGRSRYLVFFERQQRGDLILSSAAELAGTQELSAARKTVLLSGIESLQFSYFGKGATEQSEEWRDVWNERSDIPRLIRIRIAFQSGDSRAWPELLIAPRVRADVGCIYDPITTRCRGR